MQPREALEKIGSNRVIWIDDHFAKHTAEQLADMIANHLEISRKCNFENLETVLGRLDDGDEDARTDLIEHLLSVPEDKLFEIGKIFKDASVSDINGFATPDLRNTQIESVCRQLNIVSKDCWSFEGAEKKIQELFSEDDSKLSYIIDLNDAYGQDATNKRGLELIDLLHKLKSKATTFLLTHEANKLTEAQKEIELRNFLLVDAQTSHYTSPPICVIAKERLEGDPLETNVSEGLRMAIKRAGLRRNIHQVLLRAGQEIESAFQKAMNSLLEIPPEHLDEYVVGRAHAEGVSELHVVERALTGKMSESIRRLFATDPQALENAERLRALYSVPLDLKPGLPHKELEEFRKLELWENQELVNGGFSGLACGDVFKFSPDEGETDERMFILLVQPCDVMIRPKGKRDAELGFLVPLKPKTEGSSESLKQPTLPFILDSKSWLCDFRNATPARLTILDLSTLRADGKVRYDQDQTIPKTLLPGQNKNADTLIKQMQNAIKAKVQPSSNSTFLDPRCTLTLCSTGAFSKIANATHIGGSSAKVSIKTKAKVGTGNRSSSASALQVNRAPDAYRAKMAAQSGDMTPIVEAPQTTVVAQTAVVAQAEASPEADTKLQDRAVAQTGDAVQQAALPITEYLTWKIQRYGRVRMPYAASLLNSYLSLMGREAFDLDYLKPIQESCVTQCDITGTVPLDPAMPVVTDPLPSAHTQ